jgi:hypothetical protein
MLAQVVLLVWAIEPISAMWAALTGRDAISKSADALIDRFPRTMSLMVMLLALGIGSTLYDLFLLRFSYAFWPEPEMQPRRALAVRQAYEWIDRNAPRDAILQHNLNIGLDWYTGHYGNRQVAVADKAHVAQGTTEREFLKLINHIHEYFMLPRSPAAVKRMADEFRITVLVVRDTDKLWTDKTSWFWSQPALYENDRVRVISVKDLAGQPVK